MAKRWLNLSPKTSCPNTICVRSRYLHATPAGLWIISVSSQVQTLQLSVCLSAWFGTFAGLNMTDVYVLRPPWQKSFIRILVVLCYLCICAYYSLVLGTRAPGIDLLRVCCLPSICGRQCGPQPILWCWRTSDAHTHAESRH